MQSPQTKSNKPTSVLSKEHNLIEPEFAAVNDQTNENVFDQISQNTQKQEQEDQQLQIKSKSPINFSFENG